MGARHDLYILLAVLVINLILSLLYLLFCQLRKDKNRRSSGMRFAVMLLIPVAGILFFFFGWLYYHIFFHKKVDLAEVIFSKLRVRIDVKANENAERNLVPLEEAIAVTDKKNTRGLMMEVVRKNISDSLSTIALALKSEDSEVAHYGASVLQSALTTFREEVDKLMSLIREEERKLKDPEGEESAAKLSALTDNEHILIRELNAVLCQHVLTPMEQEYYVRKMNETAEMLYAHTAVSAEEMEMLCLRLLEIGDADACTVWADRSAKDWPEALPSYTNRLRLYYRTGEREKFAKEMRDLMQSGVPADHKTLEMIRLFGAGQAEE